MEEEAVEGTPSRAKAGSFAEGDSSAGSFAEEDSSAGSCSAEEDSSAGSCSAAEGSCCTVEEGYRGGAFVQICPITQEPLADAVVTVELRRIRFDAHAVAEWIWAEHARHWEEEEAQEAEVENQRVAAQGGRRANRDALAGIRFEFAAPPAVPPRRRRRRRSRPRHPLFVRDAPLCAGEMARVAAALRSVGDEAAARQVEQVAAETSGASWRSRVRLWRMLVRSLCFSAASALRCCWVFLLLVGSIGALALSGFC
jgi:hypothetical protein